MRTSEKRINLTLKKQIINSLNQVISDLNDPKEVNIFLNDFFTEAEMEAFTKRLAVAYWLEKGRSYSNIKTNLKVSSATIASVQSRLETAGFKIALKKMEAEEWADLWSKRFKKIVGK